MSVRVAIHQPLYLPWIGYFYKMVRSEIFVFWDTAQMMRGRGWGNRNTIKTANGPCRISVPIKRKSRGMQVHREVEIAGDDWRKKHLGSLQHAYGKAPFFQDYFGLFEDHLGRTWTHLDDLNMALARALCQTIGIECELRLASELGGDEEAAEATERLIRLTRRAGGDVYLSGFGGQDYMDMARFASAGVGVEIYDFVHPTYRQLWGGFLPKMSIIDLLFNEGPGTLAILQACGGGSHEPV